MAWALKCSRQVSILISFFKKTCMHIEITKFGMGCVSDIVGYEKKNKQNKTTNALIYAVGAESPKLLKEQF